MSLLAQHHSDMLAISAGGFFEDVLLIDGENHYPLRGRFVLNDMPVNPGSVAALAGAMPTLALREAQVRQCLGRALGRADKLRVHGRLYAVQEPRVHGQGWLNVRLKKLED